MRFARETDVTAAQADPAKFTDGVWRSEILPSRAGEGQEPGLQAHRFAYQPGARSAWHTHHGEQALHVVAGRGLVQRWGDAAATPIGPGDWVHVQPGEKHWHGAAPDDTLVQLAVTASGGTDWHEPVSDDDYRGASARALTRHSTPSDPPHPTSTPTVPKESV
jgi:quercetin dioxygenase-like cupin family protein